jgi:scyllo-inositol 2-dehydrogenase (NADP+)
VGSLRVGLVGYGLAGRVFHAPLVRACSDLELVAVVTRSPERVAEVAADLPGIAVAGNVPELLADHQPDIVVVASPNATHAAIAGEALDAGKAVVVDKPFALTAAEGRELVASAAGRPLTVFQNRRLDSDFRTIQRLRDQGELGKIRRFESRFERWRPGLTPGKWREVLPAAEGGGVLLDLGSHLVDQALTLNGPIDRVYAEVHALRGGGDDDAFLALTHHNGTVSHLWVSAVAAAPGPRFRVLGSAGAFVVRDLDGQEDQLRAGLPADDHGFGVEPPQRWGHLVRGVESVPVEPSRGAWAGFYPQVAAWCRGEAPPPVDPLEAVAVLAVLDAARRSADTGNTEVPE